MEKKNTFQVKTAIILAGGRGKRMIDFSQLPKGLLNKGCQPEEIHKSMILVGGKPVLEHTVLWLKKWGIKKIVIGVGHQKESILSYFGNGSSWGLEIAYAEHNPDGGTADALKEDLKKSGVVEDYFFVTNADQLTSLSLKKLTQFHFTLKIPVATIGLVYPPFPFGIVEWDSSNYRITKFKEKPVVKLLTSAGIYLFSKEIKPYLTGDLEKEVFPVLVRENKIKGYLHKGFWDTINTVKDWERINKKYAE